MREIKFRGKCIHSDIWCYGNYATNGIEAEIQGYDVYGEDVIDWREVDVEPDTVGQFTGLKDKNGKEIYEGDIIGCHNPNIKHLIFYNEEQGRFMAALGGDIENDYFGICGLDCSRWNATKEVIGNIHDNPELLEGGVNKSEFDPNRSFEENREILCKTQIDEEMSYKERLRLQKLRHGL